MNVNPNIMFALLYYSKPCFQCLTVSSNLYYYIGTEVHVYTEQHQHAAGSSMSVKQPFQDLMYLRRTYLLKRHELAAERAKLVAGMEWQAGWGADLFLWAEG